MRTHLIVLIITLFALAACSGDDPVENEHSPDVGYDDVDHSDIDDDAPLSLESVFPPEGNYHGGTEVALYGTGFVQGSTVWFGDEEADATFVSTTQIDAITPGGPIGSTVDVTVETPGGETTTLANGFDYIELEQPVLEVNWCSLQYPPTTTVEVGQPSEPIFGRAYVADCTDIGDCPQLHAQLGWGDPDADPEDDWEWVDATRNTDHDGDNNHEYQASITPDETGAYAYAFRFNVDGPTWRYCDLTGSDEGFHAANYGELIVIDEEEPSDPEIGWCNLQHPASTTVTVGESTEPIFGRVYLEDCTDGSEECTAIDAQLGWGPTDADPSADDSVFNWIDAGFNTSDTGDDNHEYQASIEPGDEGTFAYVYRFTVGESDWTYCDLAGSAEGFDTDEMGELIVEPETEPTDPEIGWCTLQFPDSTTVTVGESTEPIFGRVYLEDCTDGSEECTAIDAQLGWGPTDADPSADDAVFNWIDAGFNTADTGDDNHEYQASIEPGDEGTFAYVYRFTVGESDWTYCDLAGSAEGFDTDEMGELIVEPEEPTDPEDPEIGWCNTQFPESTIVTVGETTETIYGQVFVEDCTDSAEECTDIDAQLGWGPAVDASESPEDWTWIDAAFNDDIGDNHEYQASITPDEVGTFAYAYRFAIDGEWTYCDTTGSATGFAVEDMGELIVESDEPTADPVEIGWCNTQFPESTTVAVGESTELIYGRVYVEGCTDSAEACTAIDGQLGWGPAIDASESPEDWTWIDAAFNTTAGNDDEYQATITPNEQGTFAYAYRFSGDDGEEWTYCDTTGSGTGFHVEDVGELTVE